MPTAVQMTEAGKGHRCPGLSAPECRCVSVASGLQLRELMTADAISYGNGYALIVRDGERQPRELHRVHPQSVAIDVDSLTSEPRYKIANTDGRQRIVSFTDMLHLRAPSPLSADSVSGKSPLIEAKDAISLLIALRRASVRYPVIPPAARGRSRQAHQAVVAGRDLGQRQRRHCRS